MPVGFIQDKLDMKLLILYLLRGAYGPIDFPTLTELTLAERGTEYFLFAPAVAELAESGHVSEEDGLYAITDKGRRNCANSEESLPLVVRRRCDRRLSKLNQYLRRQAQVRAQVLPREEGGFVLRLVLDDDSGNLLTLELLAPSQQQAQAMADGFRAHPETVYNGVLSLLLPPEKGDSP